MHSQKIKFLSFKSFSNKVVYEMSSESTSVKNVYNVVLLHKTQDSGLWVHETSLFERSR